MRGKGVRRFVNIPFVAADCARCYCIDKKKWKVCEKMGVTVSTSDFAISRDALRQRVQASRDLQVPFVQQEFNRQYGSFVTQFDSYKGATLGDLKKEANVNAACAAQESASARRGFGLAISAYVWGAAAYAAGFAVNSGVTTAVGLLVAVAGTVILSRASDQARAAAKKSTDAEVFSSGLNYFGDQIKAQAPPQPTICAQPPTPSRV